MKKTQREGILNKKEACYLIPDAPKIPIIYQVPKIQKDEKNLPGRPSGIHSVFSRIGEYLNHFLQPIAQSNPSYVKDSEDLINKIKISQSKKNAYSLLM